MKTRKLIAIPAIALAAGITLAACGSSGNAYQYGSPAPTTQHADPSLNWYAIGQQDGAAANSTTGLNITYDGTTAATAYAWCADIMFLPQPTNLAARISAHLPSAGAESVQWVDGCETEWQTTPAPAPSNTVQAAQAQAVSGAQRQLAKDVSQLQQDTPKVSTGSFVSAVQQMQAAYRQEEKDYSAEQAGSCLSQNINPATVTVSNDAGALSADYQSVQAAATAVNGEEAAINADLTAVHGDLDELLSLNATPSTSYFPDVSAGQAVTSTTSAALTQYGNQAASLASAGTQLAQTATTYAQAHMCLPN
jgi:hypothetical protein